LNTNQPLLASGSKAGRFILALGLAFGRWGGVIFDRALRSAAQ
jgi:hypothetical protein